MPHLFIRLLSTPEQLEDEEFFTVSLGWIVHDDSGVITGQGITDHRGLMDLSGLNNAWDDFKHNVTVLLSNSSSITTSLEIPGKNTRQLERALPFVIEEFISSEVEDIHIATGKIKSGEPVLCHLINRQVMENCLSFFTKTGLNPSHLLIESDLIPGEKDTVSLFFEHDSVIVKTLSRAISVQRDNLTQAVNSLPADYSNIKSINGELTDFEISELKLDVNHLIEGPTGAIGLSYLAAAHTRAKTINLLQGPYKTKKTDSSSQQELNSLLRFLGVGF